MNAKVQIQFPEQLIPFYSVADIISAYSIASEAATQLRTLANQINKATAFVKTFVQENDRADSSAFAELENLIIISYQLADSQADTYIRELNRHTHKPDDQYGAGDLHDAYSLAYENTSWLETMFYQVKDEVEVVKEAIKQNTHGAVFATLERLIHIAAYWAESHSNTFDIEREKYEAEWEATKNG
ncbi:MULTISPECIES: hypothetical protein [Acinetobacter]|uniref:hypothetical protein n=1 Tax=Acinetobacter TaxID=469 RepID=UPI00019AE3C8|nr:MULTISPECIES: hypothetical protein [Acinetobacter]EEH67928.1 hypothetical protein HMPREF0023_2503 [Acinetobacter sp. ATCC 27244]NAR90521.1 hypothetical protein [Acinetobacter haemolyticus]QDJ91020.1 hypothetical protein AhaeAN54_002395 [Acinetobacter haemolyticus]